MYKPPTFPTGRQAGRLIHGDVCTEASKARVGVFNLRIKQICWYRATLYDIGFNFPLLVGPAFSAFFGIFSAALR